MFRYLHVNVLGQFSVDNRPANPYSYLIHCLVY
jgi:hypothetical protein